MSGENDMSAYAEIFASESQEFLQLMNDALLAMEEHPKDLGPVDEVFRAAHSLKGMAAAMGYESIAQTAHELEDLVAAGIIDPAKVVRTALQNASSIAGLLLTTEVIVTEKQDDEDED